MVSPRDPLFVITAIEAVVRAGDIMMARFGSDVRVDKKGIIDLVTEVDLAIEGMFRELISERFPDHAVLAEELGGSQAVPSGPCWVFDPIDGTTNFAHGLPIFCASLALEIDGVAEVAAVYDPTRHELFTAEREGGAFLNGRASRGSWHHACTATSTGSSTTATVSSSPPTRTAPRTSASARHPSPIRARRTGASSSPTSAAA